MGAGLRSPVSSVYRWQGARRDKRDGIDAVVAEACQLVKLVRRRDNDGIWVVRRD